MEFDKGRLKPEKEPEIEDSLEVKLLKLAEMQAEYQRDWKTFKHEHKHLRASIKSLKNIIENDVIALGKTVTVGNVRAEYVPTVRIQVAKEKNDEQ